MFDILPWKNWLLRALPWVLGGVVLIGFVYEFNRRGDKINRLEAAQKAAQATLESERVNHAKTVQAYQAGLDVAAKVSDRRIEVTTRLQKIESEIAHAPTTTGCASSPAIRLAVGELRDQAAPDPAR